MPHRMGRWGERFGLSCHRNGDGGDQAGEEDEERLEDLTTFERGWTEDGVFGRFP